MADMNGIQPKPITSDVTDRVIKLTNDAAQALSKDLDPQVSMYALQLLLANQIAGQVDPLAFERWFINSVMQIVKAAKTNQSIRFVIQVPEPLIKM